VPTLTRGAAAAEQISDERKSGGVPRVKQLVVKDGDAFVIHFVTEFTDLLSFDVHQFIDTKPKPEGWPGDNYPKSMWAVCQLDRVFRLRDSAGNLLDEYEEGYGNCHIHNTLAGQKDPKFGTDKAKPAAQVYGLAVLRKALQDPATGEVTGFTDECAEVKDEKGAILQVPKLVIISQKYSNFWNAVNAAAFVAPKTILDKDFVITRKGNEYNIAVATITPDLKPGTAAWKRYEEAQAIMEFDLAAHLLDHATPDHYARFFIPGVDPVGGYGRKGDDTEDSTPASADQGAAPVTGPAVDQAALADFRASLSNRGAK
jgi:hypothetical protein